MARRGIHRAAAPARVRFRYAVVDLAAAPGLAPVVMGRLASDAQPLFAPTLAVEVLAVGPWIVDLRRVPELEPEIDAHHARTPWGFFVETSVDIVSLRRVLRRFNYVHIPAKTQPVLFRYWDPRVMRGFLKIATRAQLTVLFEFIDRLEGAAGLFDEKRPAFLGPSGS